MKTVNWTPSLSDVQGSGKGTVIGLLDQTAVGDVTLQKSIVKSNGVSDFTNGHGAAVASLMVGAHDGKGVMGLAPNSTVVAYNPFDNTGTANWDDITTGVQRLKAEGANVVNISLGVPGVTFDQGWNGVFANLAVTLTLKNTVFVMAAGNEGVTQTKNIGWSLLNPAFIVVGSVDVEGNISNFSNRPGEACLTPLLGLCLGDKLKNHFMVAPGELILVSDGHGGVTRQIGTSFAAPQVAGAIALLQDRWPWLSNFPVETANIILNSAKDLGAPGVDAVYGHGLLDVTASQSPLDFSKLIWFSVENGKSTPQSSKAILATYRNGNQAKLGRQGRLLLRLRAAGPADPARLRHPPLLQAGRPDGHQPGRDAGAVPGLPGRAPGRLGGPAQHQGAGRVRLQRLRQRERGRAQRLGRRGVAVLRPAREARRLCRRAAGLPVGPARRGRAQRGGRRLRRRRPGPGPERLHPGLGLRRRARRGQPAAGPGVGRRLCGVELRPEPEAAAHRRRPGTQRPARLPACCPPSASPATGRPPTRPAPSM